jgi:hypothetical protein
MPLDPRLILAQRPLETPAEMDSRRIAQQIAQQEVELRRQEIDQRGQALRDAAMRRNQPVVEDPKKAFDLRLAKAQTIATLLENADETSYPVARDIALHLVPDAANDLPEQFDPVRVKAIAALGKEHIKQAQEEYTLSPGQTRFGPGGAVLAQVPASDKPTKAANLGSFEDYVTRTYGDNPTPENILAARKSYNQADDKATGFAAADVTKLTPQGIEIAALNYRKNGVMPPLGMGDKGNRQAIINRAATLTPADIARIEAGGTDIAGNKADYKANADTLTALTKQRASIGAFEQTAQKNIDNFLALAGKVTDTGIPLLNTPVRWAAGAGGSADQAAYQAARLVAVNEIAKITSNPALSGQLSDSARHEVEAFNPQSATLAQTKAVMALLKRDMQNRTSALDDEIAQVRGRIGSGTTGSTKTEPPPATTGGALTYADYLKSKGKK